ncbi:MAG: dockerin type I domain-containing protein [Candidatus Baldrarchaeia archaeon]
MPRLLKSAFTFAYDFRKAGDINGDGVINNADADIFMKSFLAKRGDPNYNPTCDFNGNGEVDVDDLFTLINNYGLTYEEWKARQGERAVSLLPLIGLLALTLLFGALA